MFYIKDSQPSNHQTIQPLFFCILHLICQSILRQLVSFPAISTSSIIEDKIRTAAPGAAHSLSYYLLFTIFYSMRSIISMPAKTPYYLGLEEEFSAHNYHPIPV